MYIKIPEGKDISECAGVYISAYREEPWKEIYEETAEEVLLFKKWISGNRVSTFV